MTQYTPGWGEFFGMKSSLEKLKTFSNLKGKTRERHKFKLDFKKCF